MRDIQRLLDVANWFYKQRRNLFSAIDGMEEDIIIDDEEDNEQIDGQVSNNTVCSDIYLLSNNHATCPIEINIS